MFRCLGLLCHPFEAIRVHASLQKELLQGEHEQGGFEQMQEGGINLMAGDLSTTEIVCIVHGKSTAEGTFTRLAIILQISGGRANTGRVREQFLPHNRLL